MAEDVQAEIRKRARGLLVSGEAKLVIGWTEGTEPSRLRPYFCASPEETDRLVVDGRSTHDLATYLTRAELADLKPIAIVAKPADIRAVVVLLQEDQIKPDDVRVIGVRVEPVGSPEAEVEMLPGASLDDYVRYLNDEVKGSELADDVMARVREIEKLSPAERFEFWRREFDRCIKCYACREACPMCYCRSCIVEKNQPQWISAAASPRGNFAWNLVRAMHLAGRCIACGACERACPAGIPLMLLNRHVAETTREAFGHLAGYDPEGGYCYAKWETGDSDELFG